MFFALKPEFIRGNYSHRSSEVQRSTIKNQSLWDKNRVTSNKQVRNRKLSHESSGGILRKSVGYSMVSFAQSSYYYVSNKSDYLLQCDVDILCTYDVFRSREFTPDWQLWPTVITTADNDRISTKFSSIICCNLLLQNFVLIA